MHKIEFLFHFCWITCCILGTLFSYPRNESYHLNFCKAGVWFLRCLKKAERWRSYPFHLPRKICTLSNYTVLSIWLVTLDIIVWQAAFTSNICSCLKIPRIFLQYSKLFIFKVNGPIFDYVKLMQWRNPLEINSPLNWNAKRDQDKISVWNMIKFISICSPFLYDLIQYRWPKVIRWPDHWQILLVTKIKIDETSKEMKLVQRDTAQEMKKSWCGKVNRSHL